MSRYTPPSPLQLHIFDRIPAAGRITQGTLVAASRDLATPAQIAEALVALVDLCLISTMFHTVDGVSKTLYWRTGLKPIVPPTQQELSKMVESKSSRIVRLIVLHGPIRRDDLVEQCHLDGMTSITPKNIRSMIQDQINHKKIITGKDREGGNVFMTPSQADSNPVAPASSRLEDGEEMPTADPAMLALANRALAEKLKSVEEVLDGVTTDLHKLCNALGIDDPSEAIDKIEHLHQLADARLDQPAENTLRDHIATRLGCGPLDSITDALEALIARNTPPGRLVLVLRDGDHTEIHYLEPYVQEPDAVTLAISQVNTGAAETAYLMRALYVARRKIEHGAIEAPEIETLPETA